MKYKQPDKIPNCAILPPFERICEICKVVANTTDDSIIYNMIELLRIEINRYFRVKEINMIDYILNDSYSPYEQICDICQRISDNNNDLEIGELIVLLAAEINRYDSRLFNGEELPF